MLATVALITLVCLPSAIPGKDECDTLEPAVWESVTTEQLERDWQECIQLRKTNLSFPNIKQADCRYHVQE